MRLSPTVLYMQRTPFFKKNCWFPGFVWYIKIGTRRGLIFCRHNIWSSKHKTNNDGWGGGNKSLVHKHLSTLWDVTYSLGTTQFMSRHLCLHTTCTFFFISHAVFLFYFSMTIGKKSQKKYILWIKKLLYMMFKLKAAL